VKCFSRTRVNSDVETDPEQITSVDLATYSFLGSSSEGSGPGGHSSNPRAESKNESPLQHESSGEDFYSLKRSLKLISACREVLLNPGNETEMLDQICQVVVSVGGYRMAWIGFSDPETQLTIKPVARAGYESGYLKGKHLSWSSGRVDDDAIGKSLATGKPAFIRDILTPVEGALWRAEAIGHGFASAISLPLIKEGALLGALVIYADIPDAFDQEEVDLLKHIADDLTFRLSTMRMRREYELAEKQVQLQAQRMAALKRIDSAIAGSLDHGLTFEVLIAQVTEQLSVDAADVLAYDRNSHTLNYASGLGFQTQALRYTRLMMGEGLAGKAAMQRKVLAVRDLNQCETDFNRSPLFKDERFVSYYAVPLIAKGKIQGVLEIFHREELYPDSAWLEFLDSLAGRAAIAMDNSSMFQELIQSNKLLVEAYDTTLEGWSRALEMRDHETKGHSLRVTNAAMHLAQIMGMSGPSLLKLQRGALLHDIGKMGIPDRILLKPGPLSDDEWVIMRKHPTHAHELLSPIEFLRPSIDIPYCHHEKWDGSGYPRGIEGHSIPLAARIFAVVDVWDALSSERPYRPAWSRTRVIEYIKEQAGQHFDPEVVEIFLREESYLDEVFRANGWRLD
jgi:putative nucleotidyltransferase with HDIG domain